MTIGAFKEYVYRDRDSCGWSELRLAVGLQCPSPSRERANIEDQPVLTAGEGARRGQRSITGGSNIDQGSSGEFIVHQGQIYRRG